MKAITLFELLGDVDEQLVAQARPERKPRRHFRTAWLLAAVLALLLLGFSEVTGGVVSNLFAPLYGSARTEIVDSIGRPVHASCTADGYTITAEAVVGDRYTFAIVYTLTRDDGKPIPEHIEFDDWFNTVIVSSGSGYNGAEDTEGLPANQRRLMEVRDTELPILWRHAHVTFHNLRELVENGMPGDGPLLAEGPWELDFSLRYQDATQRVSIPKNMTVTGAGGNVYTIKKLQLSPFSVHMDLLAPSPYTAENFKDAQEELPDFTVTLKMKDGAAAPYISDGYTSSGKLSDPTLKVSFTGSFDIPILPDEVDAIVICDTEIPIQP